MDLCLWNKCNNRCLMCSNPGDFGNEISSRDYSYSQLLQRMKRLADYLKKNREDLSLTGGEPTIHPDFLKLAVYLKKNFPHNKLDLVTNGRLFAYRQFTQNCLPFMDEIQIALHGHNAQLHDFVTKVKGSFKQTVKGVKNILSVKKSLKICRPEIEIRIILTKLNYQNLEKIFNFLQKNFSEAERVVVIFPEFEGVCQDNFSLVGITHQEVLPIIKKTVGRWQKRLKEIRLYHFPLCVLPPNLWPYAWRTLRGEEVIFLSSCRKCVYKKYCLGIHVDYPKFVGKKEFQPIVAKKIKLKINQGKDFIYHPIISVKQ